jgi:hypothetical protein
VRVRVRVPRPRRLLPERVLVRVRVRREAEALGRAAGYVAEKLIEYLPGVDVDDHSPARA